jgi:predicted Zn finger-like uncharacterized protein
MKFTCDSCSAAYMISDEKVGPSGVKVRCKKCGHVIVVRRRTEKDVAAVKVEAFAGAAAVAAEPRPAGAGPAAAAATPANGAGLDAELGQAFDHAFGATRPAEKEPSPSPDLSRTELMGSDEAAKVFADQGTAPAATEWYVAIGQAQVGPLPLAEVKRKWEAGDVGPDSLVWRPGMGDWTPLSAVSELAAYLAPVPQGSSRSARAGDAAPAATGPEPRAPAAPAEEPSWKPIGASALAALASEEIAARAPEPAARPATAGARSLVDALPDGGGVDPTGALPLPIKALEHTDSKKLDRRSSVARGAEQVRRRGATRALAIGVTGAVVLAAVAAGGVLYFRDSGRTGPQPAQASPPSAVAAVPLPPPPAVAAAPTAPAAAPAASAAAPAADAAPPPSASASAAAAPAASAPAAAPPSAAAASAEPERPAPRETKVARADPPRTRREARRESSRAAAAPASAPEPHPAPPPRRKDPLEFESNDAALDAALGGGKGASGRTVYVPPARASGLPDKVSAGDINGAVAQRIDALRKCVAEQKAREPDASGTLKMHWVIQGDGNVRDVRCLTTEYAQGPFAQCIAGVVKTIKFPRSATTGQDVTFPFNF